MAAVVKAAVVVAAVVMVAVVAVVAMTAMGSGGVVCGHGGSHMWQRLSPIGRPLRG